MISFPALLLSLPGMFLENRQVRVLHGDLLFNRELRTHWLTERARLCFWFSARNGPISAPDQLSHRLPIQIGAGPKPTGNMPETLSTRLGIGRPSPAEHRPSGEERKRSMKPAADGFPTPLVRPAKVGPPIMSLVFGVQPRNPIGEPRASVSSIEIYAPSAAASDPRGRGQVQPRRRRQPRSLDVWPNSLTATSS